MSIDTHTLSGAYALGALEPEEAAVFEEHLRGCDTCRAEVSEFREVASRLGASAAEKPPPALREKVITQADRVRQDPPPKVAATVIPIHRGRRWAMSLAAAALVVIAGVVGIQAMQDDAEPAPLAAPAAEVFSAVDVETAAVPTSNGGTLRVAVSPQRDEMAVDTRDLPNPGEGRVYQLWTGHDGRLTSVGTLGTADTGAAMGMPPGGDIVAVTIEPSGGSSQPTTRPIVTVEPTTI